MNPKELTSPQIHKILRKRPTSQNIEAGEYHYSVLVKKNERFILTNERFLLLKNLEYLGYARTLPLETVLPFKAASDFPELKSRFSLKQIEKVSTEKSELVVHFNKGGTKTKWEFICSSTACALEWRRRVESCIQNLKDYQDGRYEKYEDYLKDRDERAKEVADKSLLESTIAKQGLQQPKPTVEMRFSQTKPINTSKGKGEASSPQGGVESEQPLISNGEGKIAEVKEVTHSPEGKEGKEGKEVTYSPEGKAQGPIRNSLAASVASNSLVGSHVSRPTVTKFNGSQIQRNSRPTSHLFNGPQQISSLSSLNSSIVRVDFDQEHERGMEKQKTIISRIEYQEGRSDVDSRLVEAEGQMRESEMGKIEVVEMSTRNKKGAEKARSRGTNWSEEWFRRGNLKLEVMNSFSEYVKERVQKIIRNIGNPVGNPVNDLIVIEENDVLIELYFLSEANIATSDTGFKKVRKEFKNYDYLLQITRNQMPFKVPLMMLFEYKGIQGSARCLQKHLTKLQDHFQCIPKDFEEITRLPNKSLLDPATTTIGIKPSLLKGNSTYVVEKLQQFLPRDSNTNEANRILRVELLQDEDEVSVANLPKSIAERVEQLVELLETQLESFVTPEQLSDLMHACGLNIRYMSQVLGKLKSTYLKRIIRAELVARCFKNYLRFDLQECLLKGKQEQCTGRVLSLMNLLFNGSDDLWNTLDKHAHAYFHCSVLPKHEINIQYLFQTIQKNCNICLKNSLKTKAFIPEDFERFLFKVEHYSIEFTQECEAATSLIQEQSASSFNQLTKLLAPDYQSLAYYANSPIYWKILQFLQLFASPQKSPQLYSHMHYKTMFAQLKWHLKAKAPQRIIALEEQIGEYILMHVGKEHPIYAELYDTLSRYYSEVIKDTEKAIIYRRKSLEVQLKIDSESLKVSEQYYTLATLLQPTKVQQALVCYEKSKTVADSHTLDQIEPYANLCIKMQSLYLEAGRNEMANQIGFEVFKILKQEDLDELLVYSLQLIEKGFGKDYLRDADYMRTNAVDCLELMQSKPELFNRLLKVVLFPHFKLILTKECKMKILRLLGEVRESSRASAKQYIRQRLAQKLFPTNLLDALNKAEAMMTQIEKNSMVDRWKGLNKVSSQSMLINIGSALINKQFEFIADLCAIEAIFHDEFLENSLR